MKRLVVLLLALTLAACAGFDQDRSVLEPTDPGVVKTAAVGGLIIRVTTEAADQPVPASRSKPAAAPGGMVTLVYDGLNNNKAQIIRAAFDLAPPVIAQERSALPDPVKPVYVERSKRIIEIDPKKLPATLTVEGISIQVISVNRQFMTYVVKY